MNEEVGRDTPPKLIELVFHTEWDTRAGRVRHADYLVDDPRFPPGSIASLDENSSGWSIRVMGPDGLTLGIWWSEPPDSPADLIARHE